MPNCPRCDSASIYPIPLAGDLEDFYCPACDRSITGPLERPRLRAM
ncbi:hypothetical protein [Haloglomus halophilum]|nr:hypothetical protein [Haloglomus halophilum]